MGRVCFTEQPRCARAFDSVLGRLDDDVRKRQRMSHHGAVQTVLSHDCRLAPSLFSLAPLGSSVLEPNLQQNTVH